MVQSLNYPISFNSDTCQRYHIETSNGDNLMNYHFVWKTIENGVIQGFHEQTIFGETFADACNYFQLFHGAYFIGEEGFEIEITSIKITELTQWPY